MDMHIVVSWVKKHRTASIVIGVVVLYLVYQSLSSSSSTSSSTSTASGPSEALQEAQLQAQTQLQSAQIQANAQNSQVGAQLSAQLSQNQLALEEAQLQAQSQNYATGVNAQVSLAGLGVQSQSIQTAAGVQNFQNELAMIGGTVNTLATGAMGAYQIKSYTDVLNNAINSRTQIITTPKTISSEPSTSSDSLGVIKQVSLPIENSPITSEPIMSEPVAPIVSPMESVPISAPESFSFTPDFVAPEVVI